MTAFTPSEFSVAKNSTNQEHNPLRRKGKALAVQAVLNVPPSLYSKSTLSSGVDKATRRRKTTAITDNQASLISNAVNRARALELDLNHHLTIHWAKAPSTMAEADRLLRFLDCYRSWARRQGFTATYVYVREKKLSKKEHVHLMVHIPARRRAEFTRLLDGWVGSGGCSVASDTCLLQPIKPGTEHKVKRYFLKGGGADVRRRYGVSGQRGGQGTITGKRAGVSRNIS